MSATTGPCGPLHRPRMPADGSAALNVLRRAGHAGGRGRDRRPYARDLRRVGLENDGWLPSRRRRVAPSGDRRQRQAGAPADARARPAAEAAPPVRCHHRQRSRSPDLPGPGQGHGCRRSEPALGRRHHLHRDRGRLRLSGRHPRCLVAPSGRLCDQPVGRCPTDAGGPQGRPPDLSTSFGLRASFRSRGARRVRKIYRQLLAEHGLVGSMGLGGAIPTTTRWPRVS